VTPATLLGVWANPDDETYLSAGPQHGRATPWWRTEAFAALTVTPGAQVEARPPAGPLVTEVGPQAPVVSPPTGAYRWF